MTKKKRKKKPAKTPPPKKAKRTPVKRKNAGQPPKTTVEYDADPNSYPYLRMMAGKDYATDMSQRSIAELQRTPLYEIVPLDTMQRWSAQDGWVEKRRVFFDGVRKKAEEKLGTALAQSELEQLKKDQQILDDAFNRLVTKAKAKVLEANSWEGAVRAYVALAQMVTERRIRVADLVIPEPAASLQSQDHMLPVVRPRLSQEEAAAAALTIVRMRRDEMRAAMRSEEEAESGVEEKKPHMRLIEGKK